MDAHTAIHRPVVTHPDTRRDKKETARQTAFPQLAGRFRWWWQVLGSNQRRLSRRFYRPLPWPRSALTQPHDRRGVGITSAPRPETTRTNRRPPAGGQDEPTFAGEGDIGGGVVLAAVRVKDHAQCTIGAATALASPPATSPVRRDRPGCTGGRRRCWHKPDTDLGTGLSCRCWRGPCRDWLVGSSGHPLPALE